VVKRHYLVPFTSCVARAAMARIEVRATVGEEISQSWCRERRWRCPPPKILSLILSNTPLGSFLGVKNMNFFEGMNLPLCDGSKHSHAPLCMQLLSSSIDASSINLSPYSFRASCVVMDFNHVPDYCDGHHTCTMVHNHIIIF
jgi:hypothetical protein